MREHTRRHVGATMRIIQLIATPLLCLLLLQVAAAQSKPTFTGHWRLDKTKSSMRPTKWINLAMNIDHADPKLTVDVALKYEDGPDFTYRMPLTTDGRPVKVDLGKNSRTYRATWASSTLKISWNEDGDRTESWTLAPDGQTLTIVGSGALSDGTSEKWKYTMTRGK